MLLHLLVHMKGKDGSRLGSAKLQRPLEKVGTGGSLAGKC